MEAKNHRQACLRAVVILFGFAGTTALAQETQFMEGQVVVKAVDDRRVLVAVDTVGERESADGRVDHLFLFTSRVPLVDGIDRAGYARIEQRGEVTYVRIEHSGRTLELVASESAGLSHFWGFGDRGFRIGDLHGLSVDSKCDHVPGSCYRVGDFAIMFPS